MTTTFIFYMGDNGQHLGDYRLPAGKRQAYDTDIRVPFLAKGPGLVGGTKVTEVVMSIDLLPTWIEMAQGSFPQHMRWMERVWYLFYSIKYHLTHR